MEIQRKLTSLFLHRSRLWDVGERVESFGCEALALFVLQRCYVRQLQRTEGDIKICKRKPNKTKTKGGKKTTNKRRQTPSVIKSTHLDFSAWFSFFVVTGFLVLGLMRKLEGSSLTFPVVTVLPFFFTGSWKK